MLSVYLISGPLGVGKTSVSGALSKVLEHTAQVVGDDLYNLEEESELAWEEKLQRSWARILSETKSNLDKGLDVVVDFVVEDELPWLREQLSGYDSQLRYVVLMADKETLIERLKKRNELRYKDRSMILLDQLSNEPSNKKYLLDTSDKEISEIVQEITDSPRLIC